jgi:hypothetical protein
MSPLPWTTILTHGPAIVSAAKRLLDTTGVNRTQEGNPDVAARISRLEKTSVESVRLLEEMAQQIQALTLVQEQTARRARIAIAVAVAAAAVAVVAGILAVSW